MTTVPVFPLNTVLFPGVSAPLHVFEERYRRLVSDLLEIPDPGSRVFGVVAIREGYEVGDHGVQSIHRIGTLVQLGSVEPYDDGRFDIEVTGRQRLRVVELDTSGAYLRAGVELPGDADEPDAREEATRALAVFHAYRSLLSEMRGGPVLTGQLPTDPAYLSYALSATCLLTLRERQALLEADSVRERLIMLRHGLTEEMRAMQALPSLPATEVARTRWSPN
ncbi:MAG TPA: LON peptidase substrate-binding domain-containing protein [Marmoricola sp.]|nr:LON peptidase substrate-binding domain-containing protein [Marmoricola sp.]